MALNGGRRGREGEGREREREGGGGGGGGGVDKENVWSKLQSGRG